MRYRKISPHIWNDAKIRELSANGTLVFIFGLTHPALTSIGAMRATAEGLAAELSKKISREAFAKAFEEGLSKGLFRYDDEACFLWFPNFTKYNNPESPNVVKAWATAANLLPECNEKNQCLQGAKAFLDTMSKAYGEAFAKSMVKTMPNQEQEQEQYILKPVAAIKPRRPGAKKVKTVDPAKVSEQRLFSDWFCYAFQESQGDRYRFEGGKDGKTLKELLGMVPVKELVAKACGMFTDQNFPKSKRPSLGMLRAKINDYPANPNGRLDLYRERGLLPPEGIMLEDWQPWKESAP